MENERTENIFYLDLKHVHKYGSEKFQPNPLFSSQQMGTEHAGGRKKKEKKKEKTNKNKQTNKQKVGKPIGDPVGTGCPNKVTTKLFWSGWICTYSGLVSERFFKS